MSLRLRLALWIVAAVAGAVLLQGGLGYLNFQRLVVANLDRQLEGYLARLMREVVVEGDLEHELSERGIRDRPNQDYLLRARLVQQGQVVRDWNGFPNEISPAARPGLLIRHGWRVVTVPLTSQTDSPRLQVAVWSREAEQALTDYRHTLVLTVLMVSLSGALLAWWVSGPALRPLQHLLQATRQVANSADLSARVPETGGGELGQLSHTFNRMMERLAAFWQRETQFTRNASHELRTPLTSMRLQISAYREGYATAEETLDTVAQEVDRMSRLTESLLVLAREGRATRLGLDLAPLVAELARQYGASYRGPEHLPYQGDPVLLRQAVSNLLDNAQKYAPGAPIEVVLETRDGQTVIGVNDAGPGLSPEAMQRATETFYRAPGTRVPGSGLGLGVVAQVAQVHQGRLELSANQPHGLRVSLWLGDATNAYGNSD